MSSPDPSNLRLVRPEDAPPRWPPFLEQWVIPYLAEPALWPVAVAILGHVVVVFAMLLLRLMRGEIGAAGLVWLAALSAGSVALVVWEWRLFRRPRGVTVAVVLTWLVAGIVAYASDATGVM